MSLRFKYRLPKFVGEISDMSDLLEVEDKEFERAETKIGKVEDDSYLETLFSLASVRRLEIIFGLEYKPQLDIKTRIARIKAKLLASETTTVEAIERVASEFVEGDAKVIEHNEEYYFTIRAAFEGMKTREIYKAVEEIKPAHLNFNYAGYIETKWYAGIAYRKRSKITLKMREPSDVKEFISPYIGIGIGRRLTWKTLYCESYEE